MSDDFLISSRHTPIDASYASCESTFVELLVYLESDLEASLVTEYIGIQPSYFQNKGQKVENSRGIKRTTKSTYWCLSSEKKVVSKDVRHHLKWLTDQLAEKSFALAKLQRQRGVTMTVNCNWWSLGSGGPTLWPEQMKALADLNLECSFNIYLFDD